MKRSFIRTILALPVLILLNACTSSFQGEYSNPDAVEIVDDRWNETDARKTSEILIKSMLEKPWLMDFIQAKKGEKPFVLVDDVENRTDEHIDTKAMLEAIRFELINSGRIRFVEGKDRDKILKEIRYQSESGMVDQAHAKQKGKQKGSDFLLTGALSSQVHTQAGLKTVTYQTVLQLTNLETAEIVWVQKYDIKKRFNRSSSKW
ncbi:MAG: penicillin-binding protein activator LpoB [Oligoflexales bacterium]|nr:penicillin-binding protein activator LpoB [Oligoflexales bacterium]